MGGVLDKLTFGEPNYFIAYTVYGFLYVHVNCFVLLSGYFLCEKEFSVKKAVGFWLQMLFWSLLLFLVFCACGSATFSVRGLVKAIMPFTQERYWFMTTYLCMYCLVPILNAAINAMDEKLHRNALLSFFVVFIVFQNIVFWREFSHTNSCSPLFFCFLYLTAAYFKKYPIQRKVPWFLLYVGLSTLTVLSRFVLTWITIPIFGDAMGDTVFWSYNSITVYLGALCLFEVFLNLRINSQNIVAKLATHLSPLMLGVYLIHEQPEARIFIWNQVLKPFNFAHKWYMVFVVLTDSIIVFMLAAGVEKVRLYLMNCFIRRKSQIKK